MLFSFVLKLNPLMNTLYLKKLASFHLFLKGYVRGNESPLVGPTKSNDPISRSGLFVDKKFIFKVFQLALEFSAILNPKLLACNLTMLI